MNKFILNNIILWICFFLFLYVIDAVKLTLLGIVLLFFIYFIVNLVVYFFVIVKDNMTPFFTINSVILMLFAIFVFSVESVQLPPLGLGLMCSVYLIANGFIYCGAVKTTVKA